VTVPVPVITDLPGYRVAVAGLPLRAEHAKDPDGAIVVVDGRVAWWDAAAGAVDAGASAVIVAEPCEVPLEAVDALAAQRRVPIIVQRSRLREDLVAMAVEHRDGARPRVIVAECRATAVDLSAMIRDAVGWMRALAGAELDVATSSVGPLGGTALIRARHGGSVVGSMILAVTRPEGTLLRLQALGETTTEVELDDPAGRSELATSTIRGRLVAPARFEAAERAALRRAIDAIAPGRLSSDLADLRHDAGAASGIAEQLDPTRGFS
jgi:hypothetical protein